MVRNKAVTVTPLSKAYKSLAEPLMTVQTVSCGTRAAILDLSHVRFHEWTTVGNEGCVISEKKSSSLKPERVWVVDGPSCLVVVSLLALCPVS